MSSVEVLGIAVDDELIEQWRAWFAPSIQPFRIDLMSPEAAEAVPSRALDPTPEWRDTFFMYGGTWTWVDEAEFNGLRPRVRRNLLAGRRRTMHPKSTPVWPSELDRSGHQPLFDWIASTVPPSRHRAVAAPVWRRARSVLPQAEELAGSFPTSGSGANCFGTVLAAAGVPDASDVQVGPDQLSAWLDDHTEPITGTDCDDQPGIVFTWTERGKLAHAAVSLGSGWMFSKPSQSWSSPRLVRTVRETVNSWQFPGTRVSRHRILR